MKTLELLDSNERSELFVEFKLMGLININRPT